MILAGWKQIAKHLGYSVRAVQRWERKGLPVKRMGDSSRSPVVADSDQLDAWILHQHRIPSPPGLPQTVLDNYRRAAELQREVRRNRKELQRRLATLRTALAEFRMKNQETQTILTLLVQKAPIPVALSTGNALHSPSHRS